MESLGLNFWGDRRVLVTGHTGFKGGWLCAWLRRMGAKVTGYALPPATTPSLFDLAHISDGMRSIEADIRNRNRLQEVICETEPEVIFHLAAQTLVRRSYAETVETFDINVIGTATLLEAIRWCDSVKAVVVVTSDKCYENREWPWGYRESDRLGGHDPYAASKACAELVVASFRSSFFADGPAKPRIATARAGNVIGGGDWAPDRLIPDLIRGFSAGETPLIRNPSATRPWQFVLEPLHGYLMLAERLLATDGAAFSEAWNFGPDDGDAKNVQWVVEHVAALWGDGARTARDAQPQPHETFTLKIDSAKARSRLGWRPVLDAEAALDWTVRWYRTVHADPSRSTEATEQAITLYEQLLHEIASVPVL